MSLIKDSRKTTRDNQEEMRFFKAATSRAWRSLCKTQTVTWNVQTWGAADFIACTRKARRNRFWKHCQLTMSLTNKMSFYPFCIPSTLKVVLCWRMYSALLLVLEAEMSRKARRDEPNLVKATLPGLPDCSSSLVTQLIIIRCQYSVIPGDNDHVSMSRGCGVKPILSSVILEVCCVMLGSISGSNSEA